ncbi:MAG TPA: VWA domain-containing protein [Roseiflexaceae bacterium]
MHCRHAYGTSHIFGLAWVWASLLFELQFKLPRTTGDPSLWMVLRNAGARRQGARLQRLRKWLGRNVIVLVILGLLLATLLPWFSEEIVDIVPAVWSSLDPRNDDNSETATSTASGGAILAAAPSEMPAPAVLAGARAAVSASRDAAMGALTLADLAAPSGAPAVPTGVPGASDTTTSGRPGSNAAPDGAAGPPSTTSGATAPADPGVPASSPVAPRGAGAPTPGQPAIDVPRVIESPPAAGTTVPPAPEATAASPAREVTAAPTGASTLPPTATASPSASPTAAATPLPPSCGAEQRTLDVMLVVDRSGSMKDDQKLKEAKSAAKAFIQLLDLQRHQAGLATFAAYAQLERPLSHDGPALVAAIDSIAISHDTNVAAGLGMADGELTSARRNPAAAAVMIVLSDGRADEPEAETRAAAAKAHNIRIITIGLGSDVEQHVLREIAASPADFHLASSPAQLTAVYTAIAAEIAGCPIASSAPPPAPTPSKGVTLTPLHIEIP